MRKTSNRVLACFLAVALLISCCISGLILPAAADTPTTNLILDVNFDGEGSYSGWEVTDKTAIVDGAGFGGGKALEWAAGSTYCNTIYTPTLEANKLYVLRYKVSGGDAGIKLSSLSGIISEGSNGVISSTSESEVWKEFFVLFKLNAEKSSAVQLNRNDTSKVVYFDDIQIEEYKAGMNLVPNGDGAALPIANATHFLKNFSVTLGADGVWQFADANASAPKRFNFNGLAPAMAAGTELDISFRYKGVDNTQATAQLAIPDSNAAEFVVSPVNSAADANGWKTCTATLRVKQYDAGYTLNMRFTHATTVYVDDFVLAQKVSVTLDAETKDIEVGDQVTLTATTDPADATAVKWTSSDDAVATVDQNGKVTGVGSGTATITATVSGVSADTCTVTVTKPITYNGLFPNGDLEGEVVGSGWETTNTTIVDGAGFGGGKAVKVSGGYPTISGLTLKESLVPGKLYLFSFKVKGATTGLVYWTDYAAADFSVISSRYIYDGYSTTETGWKELSILFSLKDTTAPLATIEKLQLQRGGATEVYFDDFKIEEYEVGMNLAPNGDGGALPITNATHLLANFSVALSTDGDNNVWKFTDANASTPKKFNFNGFAPAMTVGNEIEVSFRYKGVDNAQATAQLAIPDSNNAEFVEGPTNSAADANGWKTCTATFRVKQYDAAYMLNMRFTHATEVLVDDFVLAQKVSVDIAEETKAIAVGEEVTLTATTVPADADVVWSSSNDEVATVDQTGKVTGVSLGDATITATVNGVKSDSCVVSVIIPATDLTLSNTALHLVPGAYKTLSVAVTPANATVGTITWSSDTPAVATVDNGKVTAVANGTATITATNGTLSASCVVTVDAYGNRIIGGDMESDTDVVWAKVTEDIGAFVAESEGAANQVLKVNASVTDGFRYLFGTGLFEANTVYTFTGRVKGTGAKFELNGSYLQSVMSGAVNVIQMSPAAGTAGDEWVEFAVTFKTKSSVNAAYALYLYNTSTTDVAYFDDLKLVKRQMDLEITTTSTSKSIIRLTDTDGNSLTDEDFESGKTIRVQIVPATGEMLMPGTLGYTNANSDFVKIFSRLESDTTGQTFTMTIPEGEFTLSAEFVTTATQSFAFDTIATSVHYKGGEADGVRFLTRMYLNGGLSVNEETGKLQMMYGGTWYDVVSMGTLLKRASNDTELTVEAATDTADSGSSAKVWKSEAYNAETNTLYRTDKTDAYIDFAVSMMTSNPGSATFMAREYNARGYIVLNGVNDVIYTDSTMTDSANAALDRLAAQS